jgi:hypothetical protein
MIRTGIIFGRDGDKVIFGVPLIAATNNLYFTGNVMPCMHCFTIAFNKISYLCLRLPYCSLVKIVLHKITKCDFSIFTANAT